MALINCTECQGQVSELAKSCPHCGAPIKDIVDTGSEGERLTTTQVTSKALKEKVAIAYIIMLIGIGFMGFSPWIDYGFRIGFCITLLGCFLQIKNKIVIWWNHG